MEVKKKKEQARLGTAEQLRSPIHCTQQFSYHITWRRKFRLSEIKVWHRRAIFWCTCTLWKVFPFTLVSWRGEYLLISWQRWRPLLLHGLRLQEDPHRGTSCVKSEILTASSANEHNIPTHNTVPASSLFPTVYTVQHSGTFWQTLGGINIGKVKENSGFCSYLVIIFM